MELDTTTQNTGTENEQQEEARIVELSKKADRSAEEGTELDGLKEGKQTRLQKRMDQLTWRAKSSEEERDAARQETQDLKSRIADLEKAKPVAPIVRKETEDINGKSFYTDEALVSMVDNKRTLNQNQNIRQQDSTAVLKAHPSFDKTHPDHDPNDPLFKTVTALYTEAYAANPRGLTLAVKRAKQILRMGDTNIDLSEELSVHSPTAPTKRDRNGDDKVTLNEDEKETAIRMYGRGDVTNPVTGRPYTESEALAKALNAKKTRTQSRRIR